MDIYDILDTKPVNLAPSLTDSLRSFGSCQDFKPGENVMVEGDASTCVYIVLEGSASILKKDNLGNNNIIATAESGAVFGEMGVFLGLKRSATIVAKTELRVLSLTNDSFMNILRSYPDTIFRLLKSLSGKLDHLNKKFIGMFNHKIMIAISTYILDQRPSDQEKLQGITLHMESLMNRTGLEHFQVTHALVNLKRLNIINDLTLEDEDIVYFQVNASVLRAYLTSISLSAAV